MHAASFPRSPRLRLVLQLLADGEEHTTRDVIRATDVCAVNSIMSELRANGFSISCRQGKRRGRRVWLYQLHGGTRHD